MKTKQENVTRTINFNRRAQRARSGPLWGLGTALLLLLALASQVRADTYVGGSIAGQTWTKANSPYRVTNHVSVSLLTINPGVTVLFEGNYVFEVAGFLTAFGTDAERITFTRTNGGGWQGIFFNYCYDGSEMAYCTISAAQNSAIRCISANPPLRSCVLSNNTSSDAGGGLYVDNRSYPGSGMLVEGCIFSSNRSTGEGGGLYLDNRTSGTEMLIQGCIFTNNTSSSHGGGASAHTGTNWIRFVNCSFVGNTANPAKAARNPVVGGGVYMDGNASFDTCTNEQNAVYSSGPDNNGAYYSAHGGGIYWSGSGSMRNTFVCHNTCQSTSGYSYAGTLSYGGGIFFSGGSLALQNCVIAYNNTYASARWPDPRGGGFYQASGSSTVVNCTIAYNNIAGFQLGGGSATILNSILYFNNGNGAQISGSPTVNYSDIQNSYAGTSNIVFQPVFVDTNSFLLSLGSRCIDAGDPSTAYNDGCQPPSMGTVRNDMGAYGGPGICPPGVPPQVIVQPSHLSSCVGYGATFSATASGTPPLSYQWFHGATLLSGQTGTTLTLTNLQAADAGNYQVIVSNVTATATSAPVNLVINDACVDLCMYAGMNITGIPGRIYELRYTTDVGNTNFSTWTFVATNTTPWFWIDTNSCRLPHRFYGVKLLP